MVDENFYREHFSKVEKNQDFEEEKDLQNENNFDFLLSDFLDEKEEEKNVIEEKKKEVDEKKNLLKLNENEEKNGKITKKSNLLSEYLEFNISELLLTYGTKRSLLYQENLMRIGAVNVDFMEGIIIKIFKKEVFIII